MGDEPLISCEEVKQLIDSGEKVIFIDLRGSGAYRNYHIKGAINIPYDPAGDPLEREMTLSALPGDALLVPYCD
jgi:rhodanese-related sulfurtransferase